MTVVFEYVCVWSWGIGGGGGTVNDSAGNYVQAHFH